VVTKAFFRRLAVALCALVLACQALAGGIEPKRALLLPTEDQHVLDAQFSVDLGQRLEDALLRGVTLVFVLEFQLTRSRNYWFDEHIASQSQVVRLSYQALTRQYRVSRGPLHLNFTSMDEALGVLGSVRQWPVVERAALRPGEHYSAELRMRLDIAQMPKPFQVYALANKDWTLVSDVVRWTYVPVAGEPR
jgi:hypothetical protein